jgi:hypothetical protein
MNIKSSALCLLCCLLLPFGAYAQEATASVTDTGMPEEEIESPAEVEQSVEEAGIPAEEPEVIYAEEEVFPPHFMKNLITCNEDEESSGERTLTIVGKKEGKCRLQYANFEMDVPMTLLGNIHGFDDLETLLKNKDISHYNYKADYIYDGLMYALNSCYNKKDYDGNREELADEYVTITRGLYAEFSNDVCSVYLLNTQDIEGATTDYGVTCKLPYKEIAGLEGYFKDLVAKYGEKRSFGDDGKITVTREQKNEHTHEADVALMYYLQKGGYCRKNAQ